MIPGMNNSDVFIERLTLMVSGLEEAAAVGPPEAVRAAAPRISHWMLVLRGEVPVLRGQAPAHPLLQGDDIVTSRLLFIDTDRGVARTISRWYRLGPRAPVALPEEAGPGDLAATFADTEVKLLLGPTARVAGTNEVGAILDTWPCDLLSVMGRMTGTNLNVRFAAVAEAWPPRPAVDGQAGQA